jgi:transcriptional regulator with XRE-family HTH domain
MSWEQQIGGRISRLRRERNLTKAEFGKRIGASGRYIGNIERGEHTITGAMIAKICSETGASADYVMFGTYDALAAISEINGFTHEQAQLVLDIAMNVIKFLGTSTGNNVLIQEVLRQHRAGQNQFVQNTDI